MKNLSTLLLVLCCLCPSWAQVSDVMPIIAYLGVPNNKTTDANFKDFSDCGFNVSLYYYSSLSEMILACNTASKYGVRILGHCPETHDTPEKAAEQLRNQDGFFGYVLQDEPSAPEIKERQREMLRLKSVDVNHCFYINLHPYYAEWTLQNTKTKSYDEYLNVATATACRQLSFDFYPITKDGLRDGWYANLETIRRHCLAKDIPFWGFVLSVPHALYPQPTLAMLRLQVYSNLAYGAQAIQYFTYWTPSPDKKNKYHDGPISTEGKKTKTYYLVQKMNQELKGVSALFLGAEVESVHHLGVIATGTERLSKVPQNLNRLRVSGKKGAVISQFKKNGRRYLAIVNKDYENSMDVYVKARNNVPCRLTKKLREERLKSYYSVAAGDMLLLRLK